MKLVINCETGEVVEREFTKAEKDQQKIDEIESAKLQAIAEEKRAARQAILDRLGLTADEAKLLLG